MSKPDVVVVGGGVIGLSAAYQLKKLGAGRVVLVDKETIGSGSSSRAAGITNTLMWTDTGTRARQIGVRIFREMSEELADYVYHDEHGCLNLFAGELPAEYQQLLPLYDRLDAPYELLDGSAIQRRWPELHPQADAVGLFDPQGDRKSVV